MASLTLTVEKVTRQSGRVYIDFSNGTQLEFSSLQNAKDYVRDLTDRLPEVLMQMAIARYLFVDPDGENPSLIEGRSITITNENNTMVRVQ